MADKAVALAYDVDLNNAPKVVASGKGKVAAQIIKRAKEYDIATFSNPELVASLLDLELDQEIPQQLYQAVADIFLWLMQNESKCA